jgi:hypothetical protein
MSPSTSRLPAATVRRVEPPSTKRGAVLTGNLGPKDERLEVRLHWLSATIPSETDVTSNSFSPLSPNS